MNNDNLEELRAAFAALQEAARRITEAIAEAVTQAVEPQRPEIPRPPKYLGPVNKANHTASRPPKRARSNCYKCRR